MVWSDAIDILDFHGVHVHFLMCFVLLIFHDMNETMPLGSENM